MKFKILFISLLVVCKISPGGAESRDRNSEGVVKIGNEYIGKFENQQSFKCPGISVHGTLECRGQNYIQLGELNGRGLIKIIDGETTISVDDFNFKGTIECDGKLQLLLSNMDSDVKKFKQKGKGELLISYLKS